MPRDAHRVGAYQFFGAPIAVQIVHICELGSIFIRGCLQPAHVGVVEAAAGGVGACCAVGDATTPT